jgi:hypothetical protein
MTETSIFSMYILITHNYIPMLAYISSYIVGLAVFLALDAAMIYTVIYPLFKKHISDLL